MFGLGGKSNVPQSSQYDFKGATVKLFIKFRSNRHQVHTSQPHPEQVMSAHREVTQDHVQTEELDSPISCLKRPTNSKAPSTESNCLKRTSSHLKKTLRSYKNK
jgi:hypothetical protein